MFVVQFVADFNLGFSLCDLFIPLGFCPQRFFPDPCGASRDLNFLICSFGPRQLVCNFFWLVGDCTCCVQYSDVVLATASSKLMLCWRQPVASNNYCCDLCDRD